MPVKAAVATFSIPPVRMTIELICMSSAIWGRWKPAARKPDMEIDRTVRIRPRSNSNVRPAMNMLLIFAVLFWWLYWAVYLTMAVLTPQSLKVAMRTGAFMAT
jgi:hypothetical protein